MVAISTTETPEAPFLCRLIRNATAKSAADAAEAYRNMSVSGLMSSWGLHFASTSSPCTVSPVSGSW